MSSPKLLEILDAVGGEVLDAYLAEHFPPRVVAIGYYTADNALEWLEIPKFMSFAARYVQKAPTMPPVPPTSSSPPASSQPSSQPDMYSDFPVSTGISQSLQSIVKKRKRAHSSDSDDNVEIVSVSTTISTGRAKISKKKPKRRQQKQQQSLLGGSDDSDVEVVSDKVFITRQFNVKEIRTITELPSTWTVYNGAWLLDLQDDAQEWKDSTGELMSMAAIIKSHDQDSWGKGSAGSTSEDKASKVIPFDGAPCQVATHFCQGVYHCSKIDMTFLDQCKRYEPDDDEMRELFHAERDVNAAEMSTIHQRAASFYKEAMKEPCKATVEMGGVPNQPCPGKPVYRQYRKQSFDGKDGFIGCDGWYRGSKAKEAKPGRHRFVAIPQDVPEDLVKELFTNGGTFSDGITTGQCACVLPIRSGAKGSKECPYTHVKDGKVIQGKLIHRPCPTKIRIFSPLNRTDRRAIVYLEHPHNHPRFPSTKLSREGKILYKNAVKAAGGARATVLTTDMATTTKDIFGGKPFEAVDPALGNSRTKRKLAREVRTADNPVGNGVLHHRDLEHNYEADKKYIRSIWIEDTRSTIIVTMLQGLANLIHTADATLHDNTYKRVHGEWKEWEIVIWEKRLNMRLTVARLYSTNETRECFERMWTAFFRAVQDVTGQVLRFKFIDGTGLKVILVDGCKPQVDGLGDALVKLNIDRKISPITESNPQIIVQYLVRTCTVHLERKLDDLAKTLPEDVMVRVRHFPFLKTEAEVNDFKIFCETSGDKRLKDWIVDKKGSPWFIPSVNQYMSKITKDDWYLTPGDTNLNESAHPFTNKHTGIHLPLLVAIKEAYKLDLGIQEKITQILQNCILPNTHNTKLERDRLNRQRYMTRATHRQRRTDAAEDIDGMKAALEELAETTKSDKARAKELREAIKQRQAEAGLKSSPRKSGSRGKNRLPTDDNIIDLNEDDSNVPSQNHGERDAILEHTNTSSNVDCASELESGQAHNFQFDSSNPTSDIDDGYPLSRIPSHLADITNTPKLQPAKISDATLQALDDTNILFARSLEFPRVQLPEWSPQKPLPFLPATSPDKQHRKFPSIELAPELDPAAQSWNSDVDLDRPLIQYTQTYQ